MFDIQSEIGTAKDNQKSPIHNWYKFTAGFSYKFIDEIKELERLNESHQIYEPFAGCGTTLVSAQKHGIPAVGNEGQDFMFDIINGKLNWNIETSTIHAYLASIQDFVEEQLNNYPIQEKAHPLLRTLYSDSCLRKLYLIRDNIEKIKEEEYRLFLKLALSQTLHKVSIHPIAIPYIVRSKTLANPGEAVETFSGIVIKMLDDLSSYRRINRTSKIYLHDSRHKNSSILDESCDICLTSPPYLNNLDYGEVSKVHTHFFQITSSWNDITSKVRQNLVTGATTHYKDKAFKLETWKGSEFNQANTQIGNELIKYASEVKTIGSSRRGKKSYDLLALHYFEDMYKVLIETRRILKPCAKAYMILGDSAPYGVFIPTTELLGRIAMNAGFNDYHIHKIRSRGTKWKSLRYRHSLELSENILVIQ